MSMAQTSAPANSTPGGVGKGQQIQPQGISTQQQNMINSQMGMFNQGVVPGPVGAATELADTGGQGIYGALGQQNAINAQTNFLTGGQNNWWGSGADPSDAGYQWDANRGQWARTQYYDPQGRPVA